MDLEEISPVCAAVTVGAAAPAATAVALLADAAATPVKGAVCKQQMPYSCTTV